MEEKFNYIEQLNGFDSWLDLHAISPSAIDLWFGLVRIANRLGRITEFNVPNVTLMQKTRLSIPAIHRARAELQKNGLLDFVIQGPRKATVYQLAVFDSESNSLKFFKSSFKSESNSESNSLKYVKSSFKSSFKRSEHIHKSKSESESKSNTQAVVQDSGYGEVIKLFSSNIHPVTPYESERLKADVDDYGKDWCLNAIKIAIRKGKFNIGYVEGILKRAKAEGRLQIARSQDSKEPMTEKEKQDLMDMGFDENCLGG